MDLRVTRALETIKAVAIADYLLADQVNSSKTYKVLVFATGANPEAAMLGIKDMLSV